MAEADAAFPLELDSWPSLEAQVAAIADDIAYDNHDIDDGLRAGILDLDELLSCRSCGGCGRRSKQRHPGLDQERKIKALVRDGIGSMVGDVLGETRRRIAEAGVRDDRRRPRRRPGAGRFLGRDGGGGTRAQALPLRPALQQRRRWPPCGARRSASSPTSPRPIARCRACCPTAGSAATGEIARLRGIGDFIAGMTDRFAIARHEELVGPVNLPDRF